MFFIDFHGCEYCGFELFECIYEANHLMTSNTCDHFANEYSTFDLTLQGLQPAYLFIGFVIWSGRVLDASQVRLRKGPLSAGTASIRVKVLRRTSMSLAVPALSFNML